MFVTNGGEIVLQMGEYLRQPIRDRLQRAEAAINAQITGLDARAARILAQPLNRSDLEQAADAEVAALLALRARRHDLFVQRAAAVEQRGAVLRGHDGVADRLDTLAAALRSWSEAPSHPEVGAVATALEGIVNASRTQRQNAPQSRSDDLSAAQAILSGQLGQLTALAQQASADQARLTDLLATAAKRLADWEKSD